MFLRKFIILNKQGSKDAKGHAKLEVRASKARLSLTVEGVDRTEDTLYKLYIVSNPSNNFKELELGTIEVDKRGKGKLELNFNADAVAKTNHSIADCNILILKRQDNITNQSEIILGGYIHRDDDTMSKIKAISNIKSNIEHTKPLNKEKLQKPETSEIPKDNKIDTSSQEPIINTEIKSHIKDETDNHKIQDQQDQQEQEQELQQQDQQETEELESYLEHFKEYDDISKQEEINTDHYGEQIASYTLDILKFFKKVNPFKIEFEDYKWWQIDHEEMNSHRGFLPYYSYVLNSSCQSQIKKNNHYLFGMVEKQDKVTHYVYAIPGKYERKEHPYGGRTGFVTWLEDKTGSGYWLSYIDAQTGNVVRPR